MKTMIVFGLTFLALTFYAIDAGAFSFGTPGTNQDQWQNARATIGGIRNGDLSAGERARLKVGRTRTHNLTQQFKSDGRIGIRERQILHGRAERGQRVIGRMTHN